MQEFDLVCSCGAAIAFSVDEDNMTGGWMLIHRFANAHAKCGFMTLPSKADAPVEHKEQRTD